MRKSSGGRSLLWIFSWIPGVSDLQSDLEHNAEDLQNHVDNTNCLRPFGDRRVSEGTKGLIRLGVMYPVYVATLLSGPEDAAAPLVRWLAGKGLRLVREGGEWVLRTRAGRVVATSQLNVSGRQFGRKMAQRARGLGLDPGNARVRHEIRSRIQRIFDSADEIRCGSFRGQGSNASDGPVLFFRRGHDVVVTPPGGDFVTLLIGGIRNQRFINGVHRPRETGVRRG